MGIASENTVPSARAGVSHGWLVAVAIVVSVGLFHGLTLRDGQLWFDDFASYVAHAKNIAEGRAYEDTGYLYNPENSVKGPRAYPPVYPLMLVPVYEARGLDLEAMKLELVVVFMLLLLVVFALLRRDHPLWVGLAVIAALGFNPFFWGFKDSVLSDIPFALFVILSMLAAGRARSTAAGARTQVPWGLLVGALMYLAYGTRTVGGVLPVALLASLAWTQRRIPVFAWVATVTTAVGVGAQALILPGGSGYTDQLALASPRLAAVNLWRYARALEGLFVNGYVSWLMTGLLVVFACLAAVGYLSRLSRSRATMAEFFVPISVVATAVWPAFQSLRFLIPVLPFLFLYAILGARELATLMRVPSLARPALVVLGVVLAGSAAGTYARVDHGPLPEGVGTATAQELFAFVRSSTEPADVLVFQRPKVLALYTGRQVTAYADGSSDEQMRAYFARVGAAYLVDGTVDHGSLSAFVGRNPGEVERVFSNAEHDVYRWKGR